MIWIFILFNLAVIGNALMRAFDHVKKKALGHVFEALMIASFMGVVILAGFGAYQPRTWANLANLILMYGFIRAGLFNALWGYFALKRWWWYLGTTSLYDRILSIPAEKWKWPQRHYLFWYYFLCYLLSIGCLTNGFLLE